MKRWTLLSIVLIVINLSLSGCSCDPERIMEWVASSSLFKGMEEVKAVGEFQRISINHSSHTDKDSSYSKIEIRLFDGQIEDLYKNEANIARQCAQTYIKTSENEDYDQIEVFIIKTQESNPNQAIYQSQYLFKVNELIDN